MNVGLNRLSFFRIDTGTSLNAPSSRTLLMQPLVVTRPPQTRYARSSTCNTIRAAHGSPGLRSVTYSLLLGCLNNAPNTQLINGKPLWALMYYLIRTGHVREAANVASDYDGAISRCEELFTTFLKSWVDSSDRRSEVTVACVELCTLTTTPEGYHSNSVIVSWPILIPTCSMRAKSILSSLLCFV